MRHSHRPIVQSPNSHPIANANVLATCRAWPQFVNLLNVNTALSQINLSHDTPAPSPSYVCICAVLRYPWQPCFCYPPHPTCLPEMQWKRRLLGTQQTVKINKASLPGHWPLATSLAMAFSVNTGRKMWTLNDSRGNLKHLHSYSSNFESFSSVQSWEKDEK